MENSGWLFPGALAHSGCRWDIYCERRKSSSVNQARSRFSPRSIKEAVMRMLHKPIYISIAAFFLAFSVFAQEGGKDANSLNAKVDAIFAQYDKPDSPGCAMGVI